MIQYVVYVAKTATDSYYSHGGLRLITPVPELALSVARSLMEKENEYDLADQVLVVAMEEGRQYSANEITGNVGVQRHVVFEAVIRSHAYDHRVIWQEDFSRGFDQLTKSSARIFSGEKYLRSPRK